MLLNYFKILFSFIKNNYRLVIIVYALVSTLFVFLLMNKNGKLSDENERYYVNQISLTEDIETYKTESGKNAVKITELTLSRNEFERVCKDQLKTIEDLNLKVKRLEYMTTTSTRTDIGAIVALKDSVILRDTIYVDTVKCFNWKDNWNEINGMIVGDSVKCEYHGTDTLNIVATKVPKKFLFFRWGCKYIQVDAVNSNPSTKITYNKAIKVK